MTRRAAVLDHIEPESVDSMHPLDLERLGATGTDDHDRVEAQKKNLALCEGRRWHAARRDSRCRSATTWRPRTSSPIPALDPSGKIPEFKYCAVRVSKVDKR